ncbi:hypothetical protein K438DRAFT_1868348 [Mycena galopus ATCC 62051]|nr:hypothetical protein K438DRAFT_1868348 [Mycena galopus ATCC 62051]
MASDSSSIQPITLHFQNLVRVAGEAIEGRVDLHVPLAHKDGIEQLQIEMRGVIKTRIRQSTGQAVIVHKQTVPLFSSSQTLWTSNSEQISSDVVSCPFRFTLPENLPPSFCYTKLSHPDATIRYSLEVVADRPGILKRNSHIRRVFLVMPAASESQVLARESLRQGWAGPWKVATQSSKIRQEIWGDYSHAHATVSLPDLASFPIVIPIPYTLQIVTETKPLNRSDRPEDKHGKPLFPAPPTHSSEVQQVLHRKTEYAVRDKLLPHEKSGQDTFDLRKSQSLADNTESSTLFRRTHAAHAQPMEPAEVHAIVDEPEWIQKDEKGRGIWRRSVRFTSTLTFPFAPSFNTETLHWGYTLKFTIPFPGMGNDLELEVPIHLGPSSACPPPTGALSYADIPPAGPPSMLDFPPDYWESNNPDWDDEKVDEKR